MSRTRGSDEHADAAARRLALLAADLGADMTRVAPARRSPPPGGRAEAADRPDGAEFGAERAGEPADGREDGRDDGRDDGREDEVAGVAPRLPRPGRHARRAGRAGRWLTVTDRIPRLGPAHLAVVAVLVAAGLALTAWWVIRDRAEPAPPDVTTGVPASPLAAVASAPPSGSPGGTGPTGATGTARGDTVTVDVAGKVRRPGIVVLDAGTRVVDAIDAAGGARRGVDLATINLARVLVDGEQIVVGRETATVPSASGDPGGTDAPTTLVNVNTASTTELEALPDVGPVTAQAIVAWRDEHGGFTSVDELLEVNGIGEVTLEQLAPHVTV